MRSTILVSAAIIARAINPETLQGTDFTLFVVMLVALIIMDTSIGYREQV